MIPRYKHQANLGIGLGLLLNIGPAAIPLVLAHGSHPPTPAFLMVIFAVRLVGWAILIYGCTMLALAKGRSPAWGAFGLLSFLGVIPVSLLLDRSDQPAPPNVPHKA